MSFQWPVKNSILTSTFGESRADHFHDGIDLVSSQNDVYPVQSGDVLFEWNRTIFPLENYWGGGNYKIIKHSNNLVSVYMHLHDGFNFKGRYGENDIIGEIGNTGHSFGRHLHFSILDISKKVSINPMLYLPQFTDKEPPKVTGYLVNINGKYVRLRKNSNIRLTQNYPILLEIKDSATKKEKFGIYKLDIILNGQKVASKTYDRLEYSSRGLTNHNELFSDHFDEKGFYKIGGIKYKNGLNRIEVTAIDYSGNKINDVFDISVTLDF